MAPGLLTFAILTYGAHDGSVNRQLSTSPDLRAICPITSIRPSSATGVLRFMSRKVLSDACPNCPVLEAVGPKPVKANAAGVVRTAAQRAFVASLLRLPHAGKTGEHCAD